jgi:hypothetical protein
MALSTSIPLAKGDTAMSALMLYCLRLAFQFGDVAAIEEMLRHADGVEHIVLDSAE